MADAFSSLAHEEKEPFGLLCGCLLLPCAYMLLMVDMAVNVRNCTYKPVLGA